MIRSHSDVRPTTALLPLLVLLASTLASMSAPAETHWKWRDAQGRITISDLPPPRDIPDRDVLQRPGGPAGKALDPPAPASAASMAAQGAPVGGRSLPEARRETPASEPAAGTKAMEARLAALRAENCERARRQLATLESGRRVARIDAQGEREVLDEAALANELRTTRQVIASDCK